MDLEGNPCGKCRRAVGWFLRLCLRTPQGRQVTVHQLSSGKHIFIACFDCLRLRIFLVCALWICLCLVGLRVWFFKVLILEDQLLRRSRRLRNLPPLTPLEPPPLPQRRRLSTGGSFEPVGVSEVLGEPKLIANRFDFDTVEVEELQADEFARNYNTPLTNLNDPVIV